MSAFGLYVTCLTRGCYGQGRWLSGSLQHCPWCRQPVVAKVPTAPSGADRPDGMVPW